MKLRAIFGYELAHRLSSATTWFFAAVLFGIAFMIVFAQAENPAAVHVNAATRIALFTVAIGVGGMLISAAIFGDAAVRDVEAGMDPLLYTTPLRKSEYLGGRFLAALVTNAIVLLAIPLGLAVAALMPYADRSAFGAFRIAVFLQPWLLFLLPNLVLAGALLFAVGVLSRQVVPVYLAAIGLIVMFIIAIQTLGQTDQPLLLTLGDPLGILSLTMLTRYWTAAEQNTQLIGFPLTLVSNRAVWLAVAAAVLVVLHRRFAFAHEDGGGRRRRARGDAAVVASPDATAVPRAAGVFGVGTTVRQTLAVLRHSLAQHAANRWFVVVLLAYVGLVQLFGAGEIGRSIFGTSTWPITVLVAEAVLNSPLVPVTFLLTAVFAGELVWQDRDAGMAEIGDATPVPNSALLIGRFGALVVMLALIQTAVVAGGVLAQALQGFHSYEIGLYLRIFLGLNLTSLVIYAALAMTVHVVVNQKYVGHIVVLLACVLPIVARENDLLRHNLLLFGLDPGWTYSDMNGFGAFVEPIVWFRSYWAAWALLLLVGAAVFWVRGREFDVRRRLRTARARFTGPALRAAGAALVLILLLGGFIIYNTNILNDYTSRDALAASQAEYERRYRRFAGVPQPTLTRAELRAEIHPEEPAVDVSGTFHLVNRTDTSIDSLHVWLYDPNVDVRSLSFDRAARAVRVDDAVRYHIFALEQPLEPGDALQLAFDVAFRPRGFTNQPAQTDVVGNGAYFNRSWLPFIGYQAAAELTGAEERARYGLAPQPPLPGPADAGQRRFRLDRLDADVVQVDAIIGTAADQIAVTPGVLQRSWTENGRRYFHYVTEAPTSFGATVFSAEYAVLEDRWNDVALSILYHPAHRYTLDGTLRSMKASLDYYTEQFGPYRESQLRVVEIPRYGGFGRAHPHTVAFTEDYFLSHVRPGEIDQPFYGTAHEVAHMWWGGQVRGAHVRGHGFLSESLANYSAMMVTEQTFGRDVARRIYDYQMNLYLLGRARVGRESSVLEVEDAPYIAYRKGAIALYTLREHIGAERVNTALRRYLERFGDGGPPYATSLDLYAELRAVTPDSLHTLLEDWFETITLWDVRTERASAERGAGGAYVVTLDVRARKLRADEAGTEEEVPMDEYVEIAVFGAGDEVLYRERHRVRSGAQTIRLTVPRAPVRAGVDPERRLIDRDRGDNVVDVASAPGGPRVE